MKKLTILLLVVSSIAMAQTKPRTHVTYEINKIEHVAYLPDTIPIYFKELVIANGEVSEKWQKGFVVWQTYRKADDSIFARGLSMKFENSFIDTSRIITRPKYYKDDYEASQPIKGLFLYSDNTKVKNQVIYTLKR